jgi:hypothetical protein
MWEHEAQPIGGRESYSSHNKNGNKRRKYKWFLEIKPGDIVLGYVTSPRKKVVAVCRITKGLHSGKNGDEIEFQKIEQLTNPIAYETLKAIPELATCEPLADNHQGSLFKLTPEEYELIRSLESADVDLITDIQIIRANKRIAKTTQQALVNARLGQGKYGIEVRKMWKGRCAVTGCRTMEALEASHIKRWAVSTDLERLDRNNGLLLTATLHKLFDSGLISFQDSGKMLVSSKLAGAERNILGLIRKRLLQKPPSKMAKYLSYHRQFFEMKCATV